MPTQLARAAARQPIRSIDPAKIRTIVHVAFLAMLMAFLFFHGLTSRDLWGSHEARAAQDAGSMLHTHDWTMPRLTDERLDLQKPPMYYWLVASIAWLRDGEVDAWAARLPAAIAATLTVLLVYFALAWRGRPTAALLAATMLATAQHFTWLARTARIDMPLTLCTAVAVLSIALSRRWRVIGYIAIAAGVLLKGPIGLVLPVAALVGFAIVQRFARQRTPALRSMLWGIPLSVALAAPWFVIANVKTQGEFFRIFFWYHNFQRAMGGASELAVHPWWYYVPRLLVDALPWSLLIVPALIWLFRGGWRIDREARLGGIWLLAVVGVLSFAKFKRADYLLPAYPGLAILLGCAGQRLLKMLSPWAQLTRAGEPDPPQPPPNRGGLGGVRLAGARTIRRILVGGFVIILIAVIGTWIWLIHIEHPRLEPLRESATFAARVREVAPAPAPVLFFRVESHALAFHLGRPINTFLEWENLDVWAGKPEPHYVLMPPEAAAEWPQHLKSGRLEEVFRNTDFSGGQHEKPVVLMRTRSIAKGQHAASQQQAAGFRKADQHGAAGAQPGGAARTGPARLDFDTQEARPPVRDSGGG